jgi:hypothetical protein
MMPPESLVRVGVIAMIALLDVASGHMSFVDMNSQNACDIKANDGINGSLSQSWRARGTPNGGCMGRSIASARSKVHSLCL